MNNKCSKWRRVTIPSGDTKSLEIDLGRDYRDAQIYCPEITGIDSSVFVLSCRIPNGEAVSGASSKTVNDKRMFIVEGIWARLIKISLASSQEKEKVFHIRGLSPLETIER